MGRIREFFRKRRERAKDKADAESEVLRFYDEQSTDDTVVFVHGLGGHFSKTWSAFPELLRSDTELPRFDILLWGYDASPVPGRAGIAAEARRLMSDLRLASPRAQSVFLIGHSMGGLTVLHGLCEEHKAGRAQDQPARSVQCIVLYASPVLGAAAASVATYTIGKIPLVREVVSQYVQELSGGHFVNTLIGEVNERIYRPNIRPGDERSMRAIPVLACVANHDKLVDSASAVAIFKDPPPVYLDFDHSKVKRPTSHRDRRYLPVKNLLLDHYTRWFHAIIRRAQQSDGAGRRAAKELLERCRHTFAEALRSVPNGYPPDGQHEQREQVLREFLSTVAATAVEWPQATLPQVIRTARDIYALDK